MKLSTTIGLIGSAATLALMIAIGVNAAQARGLSTQEPIDNKPYQSKQIECLALNVYFEARGESTLGQRAVAWTTLNRVDHNEYPDSICGVVWEDSQFSWTNDGKSDTPKDSEAWTEAQKIAWSVWYEHMFGLYDPTDGSIMFHADNVKPYWRKDFERTSQIDGHIFYKDEM
jgi:spore germination cell wall hydrolase CwlJ-like protein